MKLKFRRSIKSHELGGTSCDNGYQIAGGQKKIPLAVKAIYTVFVAVLIPVYLHEYGPTNFLWFCDTALLLAVIGMWLESPLLISMCAVGILVPQILWIIDFGTNLFGVHLAGLTDYMLDQGIPISIRALSLFHGWLPVLLIWLLSRLGYDKRALPAWTALASVLIFVCYFFTPPAGAHLANSKIPLNINNVYGFDDKQPQHWLNQNLYVILWIGALWLGAFLPTHLFLRKFFASPEHDADAKCSSQHSLKPRSLQA